MRGLYRSRYALMGVMWICMMLVSPANLGLAQAPLNVGVGITNIAGRGVYLTKARPQKLFNWAGEAVMGVVELVNTNPQPKTVQVKVHLLADLDMDRKIGAKEKVVEVPGAGTQRVEFAWGGKEVGLYGHALVTEVLEDGKSIAKGESYFGVASNLWEICIVGSSPCSTGEQVKTKAGIEWAVERFREKYLNAFERFFWAPDDFGEMTPTKAEWFSGQARYHENLERLKYLCEYGRQIGVMPTTYGKCMGSGSGARDLIRRRPELIYGFGGEMDYHPDTEELAKWDINERIDGKGWQSIAWAFYNMNDPAVVQYGIDEIIGSTKQFGWAAVRFDGHFQARMGKQQVGDKVVDFTPAMTDKQTAASQKTLKQQALRLFPRYAFGYNYVGCLSMNMALETNPRETIEVCEGGGLVMDEGARGNAHSTQHPWARWADYAAGVARQNEEVRRLGGYSLPLVEDGLIARYQTMLVFAAGAHPGMAMPWAMEHPYNAFATRYSCLLWHKDIKPIWYPNGLVIAPSSVWWENFVRVHDLDATRRRLIIHLINPPPQELAIETFGQVKEQQSRRERRRKIVAEANEKKIKPDFTELDVLPPLKLTPEPKKDVWVRIVPQAFDRPWKARRVILLDPETTTQKELALNTEDPYFWELKVPEIKFWAVVVLELASKK